MTLSKLLAYSKTWIRERTQGTGHSESPFIGSNAVGNAPDGNASLVNERCEHKRCARVAMAHAVSQCQPLVSMLRSMYIKAFPYSEGGRGGF